MSVLDGAALVIIFVLVILVAVAIVALGTLPGKIARKRDHPYPDAVNAASWIGLATGVFWPVAFIWAFLPVPGNRGDRSADTGAELADLRRRLGALEASSAKPGPPSAGNAS
jgi:hypothetical protein